MRTRHVVICLAMLAVLLGAAYGVGAAAVGVLIFFLLLNGFSGA